MYLTKLSETVCQDADRLPHTYEYGHLCNTILLIIVNVIAQKSPRCNSYDVCLYRNTYNERWWSIEY